jgi:hypothetical protein
VTATVTPAADHGLLSALAIAYGEAGYRDRPAKLAHASAHVGRLLASTAELTAEEARALRRHVRRCAAGCTVATTSTTPAASTSSTTCGCVTGGQSGHPSACDPTGTGRYCPPAICWCGSCPWWKPAPPVNYAAAIAKLAEQTGGRR